MFTGLVEAVGVVRERRELDRGARLTIEAPFVDELAAGESVAVDGVCLTAEDRDGEAFTTTAVLTTLERTTVGEYGPGRRVNLERALRAGDRMGGHFVQGHVDAVGEVAGLERRGETVLLSVRLPPDVARTTVERGSLALDGVSLTVSRLEGEVAEIALIPHTWTHTALDRLQPGDDVNLEADLLGKYVARLLGTPEGPARGTDTGAG